MRSTFLLHGLALGAMLFIPLQAQAAETELPISVTLVKCGETKADIPKACAADNRCCVFMDQAPQTLATSEWVENIIAPTPLLKPETFIEAELQTPSAPTGASLPARLVPVRSEAPASAERTVYRSAYADNYGTVIE